MTWQDGLGRARRGKAWQARLGKIGQGLAWQGWHDKGGEDMERSEALIEAIMKRIALVEIHHQTGEWIDEKDVYLKKIEDKKTA